MTLPATPSLWVQTWAPLIRQGGRVLDVACGNGRHAYWLAQRGYQVEAVDQDAALVEALQSKPGIHVRQQDLESGPWPYAEETFDGVVVTNYLHRPLFPVLISALRPRGVLIYETFAMGNERYGRPTRPEFLLMPGELLQTVRSKLRVIAYEDRFIDSPKPAMVQRICAVATQDLGDVWR